MHNIRRHFGDIIISFWRENNMGDMLILIIYPLRINLVYFHWNFQTKFKKVSIAIDYNGLNV